MTDIPELTEKHFKRAIKASVRRRLRNGIVESGQDIVDLRRFLSMSQTEFARALGISVHTLRNWEQNRRKPHGPALALIRVAARHPKIIRESLSSAA